MIAGLDVSTRRLAVVGLDSDGCTVEWWVKRLADTDQQRCADGYEWVADVLYNYNLHVLAIELPPMVRSPRVHAQLAMIVGACTAAASCPVVHVNVQEWKRALGLSGNASKQQVRDEVLRRWPDLPADDQDVLDAAGIAWYAHSMREPS